MNKFAIMFMVLSQQVFALPGDALEPINIKAYTVIIDEIKGVSIYQGDASLSQGSLSLSAERIQIFNNQKSATKIIAKGKNTKRAHYQQNQQNQVRFIEAKALKITYFISEQKLRLEGDAYLVQGFNSFRGGRLDYDIKNDKMIAKKSKKGNRRVQFKIRL
jgi:lipopolysaccharide export system protein LptA